MIDSANAAGDTMARRDDNETTLELQLRLLLETQCGELFDRLYVQPLHMHAFTVLAFDFGSTGHAAFKSNLSRSELVALFEDLISSFTGGPPRFAPRGVNAELLRVLAGLAKDILPAGIGYVIVIGDSAASAYVANADRDDVVRMLENEALPAWRAGE
jgi:hypothetical protein